MRTIRTEHTFIDILSSSPQSRQSHPTHNRASYEYVRRQIRTLRRHSPKHMDVLWYASSLGIEPFEVYVCKRKGYSFPNRQWEELPRNVSPRGWVGTYIETVGPLGKLP